MMEFLASGSEWIPIPLTTLHEMIPLGIYQFWTAIGFLYLVFAGSRELYLEWRSPRPSSVQVRYGLTLLAGAAGFAIIGAAAAIPLLVAMTPHTIKVWRN